MYGETRCWVRRIDCFTEWTGTAAFGEKMKEQVEERLRFYEEGIAPTKNITAMQVPPALSTTASRTMPPPGLVTGFLL